MPPPPNTLVVNREEAGLKLLRFLERRLALPRSLLHKWIRSGQVRVNSGRAKAFDRLDAGDKLRLPPFAAPDVAAPPAPEPKDLGPGLKLVGRAGDILVLDKAAGLAVQPGPGISDSVSQRLAQAYAGLTYLPAPAHRLDKHCSGLILAGLTHTAQRGLHELFAAENSGLVKEYLAWVSGDWPGGETRLEDFLESGLDADGLERMRLAEPGAAIRPGRPDRAKRARATAFPLRARLRAGLVFTLLRLTLLSGRKHQLRVQLAGRGRPIVGDARYGGPPHPFLLLHAWRVTLPDGQSFTSEPEHWAGHFRP